MIPEKKKEMVTTVPVCEHKNSEGKEKVGTLGTYGAPK